ncbi:MAG: ArnT family glycosyltransferase [Chthoniobacterales bacterium]
MVASARTFSLEDTFLSPQILNPPPTRHALLAFLLTLAALIHIGTAGWGDLYDGTEGEVAGGARAMLASGNWLTPTNDGAPLLAVPPLTYWLVALSYKAFGVTATAARLPIALAMIGTVALTFLIGERIAGYLRGFAAGLILLCSAGGFLHGRAVSPDAFCAFFVCASIYCVVRGYQHQKFRRLWYAVFWFCAGLATLTKGLSALVLLAGILLFLVIPFREARLRFRPLFHWVNLLVFALIVAPWFYWIEKQYPGFVSRFVRWADTSRGLPRGQFLLLHFVWWFPVVFLVLPGLLFAPRKILRPDEAAFADWLPLSWLCVGLGIAMVLGGERACSTTALAPAFALFAACAWERTSRPLRVAGITLALIAGLGAGAVIYFHPANVGILIDESITDALWFSLRPLDQIAMVSLLAASLAAFFVLRHRAEVTLVVAVAAMVPIGFCLIESRARLSPFLSLGDVAKFLNPRLSPNGEVIYEGSLRSGSSLGFYLGKNFFLIHENPGFFERDAESQRKYLDEHFLLDAWDRSDPLYLIIDEKRVAYWRELITSRVHIYHQVTTCGSRVVLSNQL